MSSAAEREAKKTAKEALPVLRTALRAVLFCVTAGAISSASHAQSVVLDLPAVSQRAETSQRIGLTDIVIKYHRPLVKDRKIWNGLVPYGKVWRAGANENTTISASDPVQIEGQPLDAGTYGLHMIPNESEWTVIFSRNSTSWGPFTYDQAEDALRVAVKPLPVEMHNALTYEFDDPQPDSTLGEGRRSVQGGRRCSHRGPGELEKTAPQSFSDHLDELGRRRELSARRKNSTPAMALAYANKSIENEDRYDNEITKSRILLTLGRKDESAAAEKKALALANAFQIHTYARQLMSEKRRKEAFAIFNDNALKHPDQWFVCTGLARVYSAQGKFEDAAMEMKIALRAAPDSQKVYLDGLVKQLEAKQDINQ